MRGKVHRHVALVAARGRCSDRRTRTRTQLAAHRAASGFSLLRLSVPARLADRRDRLSALLWGAVFWALA